MRCGYISSGQGLKSSRLGDDTILRLSSELLGFAILSLDDSSHHLERCREDNETERQNTA